MPLPHEGRPLTHKRRANYGRTCDRGPVQIRVAQRKDDAAIDELLQTAMGDHVPPFVARLRADPNHNSELEFVADDDGTVVGFVMLDYVGLENELKDTILVLTPLAVIPDRQRAGIGSALVNHCIEVSNQLGEPLLFVEGIPGYYPKFGFQSAADVGLIKPDEKIPDAAFMVKLLNNYAPEVRGQVRYTSAYEGLPDPPSLDDSAL
jgi:putative acetyltransferase